MSPSTKTKDNWLLGRRKMSALRGEFVAIGGAIKQNASRPKIGIGRAKNAWVLCGKTKGRVTARISCVSQPRPKSKNDRLRFDSGSCLGFALIKKRSV